MEYVTTETPITVSDVTLIPVVRICQQRNDFKLGHGLSGKKEPLAIILCDKHGVHAFDMNASAITISSLLEKIPELDTVLLACKKN